MGRGSSLIIINHSLSLFPSLSVTQMFTACKCKTFQEAQTVITSIYTHYELLHDIHSHPLKPRRPGWMNHSKAAEKAFSVSEGCPLHAPSEVLASHCCSVLSRRRLSVLTSSCHLCRGSSVMPAAAVTKRLDRHFDFCGNRIQVSLLLPASANIILWDHSYSTKGAGGQMFQRYFTCHPSSWKLHVTEK